MTIKKSLFIVVILIVLIVCWMFHYRSTCEGCGGCGYEEFSDYVRIEKIICKNDSMCTIYLKSLTENYTYQIYPGEFGRIETNFDKKEIINTSKTYKIYGSRITYGTCEPYGINKMILF